MPKFYRQNRKKIDPRYFLQETIDRDLNEDGNLFGDLVNIAVDAGAAILGTPSKEEVEGFCEILKNDTIRNLMVEKMYEDPSIAFNAIKAKLKEKVILSVALESQAELFFNWISTKITEETKSKITLDEAKALASSASKIGCSLVR